MADDNGYYDYLLKRSSLGLFYRNTILYPRISPYLHGRTLDVGCGIGDMLRFRPGTVGVDINPRNVEYCRQHGMEAHVMAPDELPFANGAFESVILDNVLEHVAQPTPLLSEIARVLCKSGTLVVGVPGRRGYQTDEDHKVFYDDAALTACVSAQGYTLRNVFHTPFRSSFLDRKMRQYCVYGVFCRP